MSSPAPAPPPHTTPAVPPAASNAQLAALLAEAYTDLDALRRDLAAARARAARAERTLAALHAADPADPARAILAAEDRAARAEAARDAADARLRALAHSWDRAQDALRAAERRAGAARSDFALALADAARGRPRGGADAAGQPPLKRARQHSPAPDWADPDPARAHSRSRSPSVDALLLEATTPAPAPAAAPPGGFPATNAHGERICRQCGRPGRLKDGRPVEKWGPGPRGPGTVCDRCRKRAKRVERRMRAGGSAGAVSDDARQRGPGAPAIATLEGAGRRLERMQMEEETDALESDTEGSAGAGGGGMVRDAEAALLEAIDAAEASGGSASGDDVWRRARPQWDAPVVC